jgi:hypothetical protein
LNLLFKLVQKGLPWPLGDFENKRSFCSIENICFVIKELIDRGYGRPTQPISGDDDAPPVQVEHAFAGQRVKSLLDQITAK